MLLCVGVAFAMEPVLELLSGGQIDWTGMRLLVSASAAGGGGSNTSIETMEAEARTRLGPRVLELARRVRVSSDTTAGDLLDAGDAVADRLDANLALWEVYEARYYTSKAVELDGALPLQPWLRPALVSLAAGKGRSSPPASGVSGLVVDARGLKVLPAIAPRLKDPSGDVLYAVQGLTEFAAAQRGPVVYVRDPADVAAAQRAGEEPLFVRAVTVADGTDLVLSAEDAQAVRDAARDAPFLLAGQVVVVVSP